MPNESGLRKNLHRDSQRATKTRKYRSRDNNLNIRPARPTPQEIQNAKGKTISDVITHDLRVLFCGINPGLYTAAIGHHFGRPGNRFWPALFGAGITPRLLSPYEERELLTYGYGITNLVARATATAAEISRAELVKGAKILEGKVQQNTPHVLAFLGVTAYRTAYGRKQISIGPQPERINNTLLWVLPNPSGLNAHYQMADLIALFKELKTFVIS